MATFALVHGAWHGGWAWDLLRDALEARGHEVTAPDLPCEDVDAGIEDYARCVPRADVAVGHSLGGLTIPLVDARLRVYLCALWPGLDRIDAYVPGFGDARTRDERGRSYYPDPADAARELQYPPEAVALAEKLRRQAPVDSTVVAAGPSLYVVCNRDAAIRPDWQRRAAHACDRAVELGAGHSPMLTHPRELAEILESAAREAGIV
jgi:pimeloyl-ACP methyl ester carboxylesterase